MIAEGNVIPGSQVSVTTSKGRRVVDHLIQTPDGKKVAVEGKSGNAVRNPKQIAKDSAMATEGGIIGGKNAPADLAGERVVLPTVERHAN